MVEGRFHAVPCSYVPHKLELEKGESGGIEFKSCLDMPHSFVTPYLIRKRQYVHVGGNVNVQYVECILLTQIVRKVDEAGAARLRYPVVNYHKLFIVVPVRRDVIHLGRGRLPMIDVAVYQLLIVTYVVTIEWGRAREIVQSVSLGRHQSAHTPKSYPQRDGSLAAYRQG